MTTLAELPDPFHYRHAIEAGIGRAILRKALDDGLVLRLRRGWYSRASASVPEGEHWEVTRQDHLRRLRQALQDHPGCAASHVSASVVHDLPILIAPGAEVELVRVENYPSSQRLPGVVIHHTDSAETPTEIIDGLRVTSVARAVADTLRTRRLPHGLALLDQSLRTGRVEMESVRRVLDEQRRWVGRPRALQALDLADIRRESWGESYSFGVLAVAEMPVPIPQVELYDASFSFVARLDGLLDHQRVGAEVDGKEKYLMDRGASTPEESALGRLAAEAKRHRRIEALGLALARWTVDEALKTPEVVHERVSEAAARARRMTFTGWVRWEGSYRKLPLMPAAGSSPRETPGDVNDSHQTRSVA